MENKEESIQRAETRIEKLKLTNVTLYQVGLLLLVCVCMCVCEEEETYS